ncbi:MAG: hypothetical protein AB8B53_13710 [Flavobacteriales bacterium]
MTNYKIEFENIDWERLSKGAKQKQFQTDKINMRLLRLEDDFNEIEWCKNGHVGYVLNGEMVLDFTGKEEHYKSGDAFIIKSGESNKHKAKIRRGKFVELILVDEPYIQ